MMLPRTLFLNRKFKKRNRFLQNLNASTFFNFLVSKKFTAFAPARHSASANALGLSHKY